MWFDARELGSFLRSDLLRSRFLTRPSVSPSMETRNEVRAGERICPRCKETLREQSFAGVRLDRCDGCHGTWFDDGEVRMTVERFRKGARSGDPGLLSEIRAGLGAAGVELFHTVRQQEQASPE
jgi:hypothetical protein